MSCVEENFFFKKEGKGMYIILCSATRFYASYFNIRRYFADRYGESFGKETLSGSARGKALKELRKNGISTR